MWEENLNLNLNLKVQFLRIRNTKPRNVFFKAMAFFGNGFLHETHNYRSPGPTSGPFAPNWPVTSSPNQQAEPLASPTRPSQAQRTAVSSTATTPQTHDRAPHQHHKPHRIGKHPNAKQRRLQACQLLQTTTVRDPTCSPHSTFTPYLAIPPGSTLPPSLPTASRFPMSFPGHNSKIQEEDCWRP